MNRFLDQAKQIAKSLQASGKPSAIGYPALDEHNYSELVDSFADSSDWPQSFLEYQSRADEQLEAFRMAGVEPVAVDISGEDFRRFREANGFANIDPQSRNAFCAYKATNHAK